ncbi:hypothetical protein AVEN_194849-1 [Araneus ventricosus]|uniref:Uncharacterized protein n=1 Tax=Araneus ventricosus TaxID=182803 RepID=A0A4Y2B553_ARAVE|nr:hypothetical protein AVEN_194849-1 [Araneus ventricosus]
MLSRRQLRLPSHTNGRAFDLRGPGLHKLQSESRDLGVYSGTPGWVGSWGGFRTLTTEPTPTGGTRIDPLTTRDASTDDGGFNMHQTRMSRGSSVTSGFEPAIADPETETSPPDYHGFIAE